MREQRKYKPQDTTGIAGAVAEKGFATTKPVHSAADLSRLVEACEQSLSGEIVRRQRDTVFGVRDALNAISLLKPLANGLPLITLAQAIVGSGARPVRTVFFDKSPDANWRVPRHQDMTIAVKQRKDVPGFDA